MNYENGAKYSGQWVDDVKHDTGKAIYYWPNEDKFEGPFDNDKMHGDGLFTPVDGEP